MKMWDKGAESGDLKKIIMLYKKTIFSHLENRVLIKLFTEYIVEQQR